MNEIEDNILTKKKFALLIENTVIKHRLGYMDAIIHICEERGIDPSEIGKLVSPVIKEKLQAECVKNRLIKVDDTAGVLPV
jgi:hypothetical protein